MELNQLKTLNVDWLGHCPTCGREEHTVSTSEGNKDYLYEDDAVKCWCGQTGVIEVGDGHAWCNWGKKEVSEWDKFNAYYREKYPEYWELLPKANHQACTHHEELFNSWVEAKSQAVPDGFMLVKKRNVIGNPKVDWLQAPKWAKYWLKDGYSNKFWWCSNRPKLEEDYLLFHGRYSAEEAPSFGFNGDWKKSMTSRKAMLEAQEQSHE